MATDKNKGNSSDEMVLKPDLDITFGNKAVLKRSEETGIPLEDETVIALMEGDSDNANVDTELSAIYASTISRPDHTIAYPDPASLKKNVVFVPIAARYAAAALILLLISIGAWFTFSPATSPDRVQYTLASIDTKSPELIMNSINGIQYNNMEGDEMIPARPEYVLSPIAQKDADPLQVQYTMSVSDKMSGISPSNTQNPTPNTYLASTDEHKKRTLVGKVFNGMFNKVKEPFVRNDAQAKPGPEKGFSIWNIAELGVKGVNTLGDREYTLVRNYNEEGKVTRVVVIDE